MFTYVSLLKGLNVGGHNKIKMTELKKSIEGIGATNVITYIQSGNVVFNHSEADSELIRKKIENSVELHIGKWIPCWVFRNTLLEKITATLPFDDLDTIDDGSHIMLSFLDRTPDSHAYKKIYDRVLSPERIEINQSTIFLYCPKGYGKTTFNNHFLEKNLSLHSTTRNLNSINQLLKLSHSSSLNGELMA